MIKPGIMKSGFPHPKKLNKTEVIRFKFCNWERSQVQNACSLMTMSRIKQEVLASKFPFMTLEHNISICFSLTICFTGVLWCLILWSGNILTLTSDKGNNKSHEQVAFSFMLNKLDQMLSKVPSYYQVPWNFLDHWIIEM